MLERIIAVGGSAGKGTTTALLHAILHAAAPTERLGLYLPRPHGRWPFPEVCFVTGWGTCWPLAPVAQASPLQRLTEAGARMAVVEGYALPGTADDFRPHGPVLPVITTICADAGRSPIAEAHQIAGHACQVGTPVVAASMPAEAAAVVQQIADARHVPVIWAPPRAATCLTVVAGGRVRIGVTTARASYAATLQLRGCCQRDNVALAIAVAECLDVPPAAIVAGLEACPPLGARLQYVRHGSQRRLIDFVKNPTGAQNPRGLPGRSASRRRADPDRPGEHARPVGRILSPVASWLGWGGNPAQLPGEAPVVVFATPDPALAYPPGPPRVGDML